MYHGIAGHACSDLQARPPNMTFHSDKRIWCSGAAAVIDGQVPDGTEPHVEPLNVCTDVKS